MTDVRTRLDLVTKDGESVRSDTKTKLETVIKALDNLTKKLDAAKRETTDLVCLKFRNFESGFKSNLQNQNETVNEVMKNLKSEIKSEVNAQNEAVTEIGKKLDVAKETNALLIRTEVRNFKSEIQAEVQARDEAVKQTRDELNKVSAMCTYNKLIWPIRDFKDLQAKDSNIYSSPFYSWDHGYKLKLWVYPNGDGVGKGTHLSVGVVVTKGGYDAILPWPFNRGVKITLLSQQQVKRDHLVRIVDFSRASSECTARPSADRTTGRGYPTFISHEELGNSPYLVDDTIFLQAQVME